MDQNGVSKSEISRNSNKHYYFHPFIKKILPFLVPASLLSLLLSNTSTFPFFFIYKFHSTLLFPLFTHAFDRKYMFLICNGILALLVKTLSFNNSSSLSVSDLNDHDSSAKATVVRGEPVSESSLEMNVALPDEQEKRATQLKVALAGEEHEYFQFQAAPEKDVLAIDKIPGNVNEKANVSFTAENELRKTGAFVIESEELDMSEVEEEGDDMEESCGALPEEETDVNINTEELNKKFEEFIRKMKEEIIIQARQQQLITV